MFVFNDIFNSNAPTVLSNHPLVSNPKKNNHNFIRCQFRFPRNPTDNGKNLTTKSYKWNVEYFMVYVSEPV